MKKFHKILALLTAATLLFASGAFAASGESGASFRPAPTSSLAQNVEDMANFAGISIVAGVTAQDDAAVSTAKVTADGVSSASVRYDEIGDWDGAESFGHFGLVLSGDGSDSFTVGGTETNYEIEGRPYNSVIVLGAEDRDEKNTGGGSETRDDKSAQEGAEGAGIYADMPSMEFDHLYISTDGYGRSALHLTADVEEAVIHDSTIIATGANGVDSSAPGVVCMYASSRPVLTESSGNVYFYNSDLISSDWGVYSLDGCYGANVYIVDCYSENVYGGYSMYSLGATAGQENSCWFYGSYAGSAQYGAILCSAGRIYTGALSDAPENALARLDGRALRGSTLYNGWSYIGGLTNAMSMQADISGATTVGILDAKHTIFDSAAVLDRDGEPFVDTMDIFDYKDDSAIGAAYYFLDYIHGSAICVRSENVDMTLDDCLVFAGNDCAIQTVIGYDEMANGIRVADGTEYYGQNIIIRDMALTGDIRHEDYQRKMVLGLEDAELYGAVVSGTRAAWQSNIEAQINENWDETDEKLGHSKETIIAALCYDESYETVWGVRMSMDKNSTWMVAGDSSLYSLTIEDGAEIVAPAGHELEIYMGCDMDNEDLFYDHTTGTRVDSLEAGEYSGVVILVK